MKEPASAAALFPAHPPIVIGGILATRKGKLLRVNKCRGKVFKHRWHAARLVVSVQLETVSPCVRMVLVLLRIPMFKKSTPASDV